MKLKTLVLLVGIVFIQQSFFGRNNSVKKETTFSHSINQFEQRGTNLDHRYGHFDGANDEIRINQFNTKWNEESKGGKNKQSSLARELKPKKPKVLVGKYKNGLKHGQWIIDDNGRITETNYELGIKNGLFCDVEANGDTLTIGNYLNDQRHGLWKKGIYTGFFYGEHELMYVEHTNYESGIKTGAFYKIDSKGDTLTNGFFSNDYRHGLWLESREKELVDSGAYNMGQKIGMWYTRYANYWVRVEHVDPKTIGHREEFYHSGQQKYRVSYDEDTGVKIVETWFPNGNLCSHEEYLGRDETGVWSYYHESGKIATKFTYTDFQRIAEMWSETGEVIPNDSLLNRPIDDLEVRKCMYQVVQQIPSVTDNLGNPISGLVVVGYSVDIDGSIRDFKILKSENVLLSEEVYQTFRDLPSCTPVKEDNHLTQFKTYLQISFTRY